MKEVGSFAQTRCKLKLLCFGLLGICVPSHANQLFHAQPHCDQRRGQNQENSGDCQDLSRKVQVQPVDIGIAQEFPVHGLLACYHQEQKCLHAVPSSPGQDPCATGKDHHARKRRQGDIVHSHESAQHHIASMARRGHRKNKSWDLAKACAISTFAIQVKTSFTKRQGLCRIRVQLEQLKPPNNCPSLISLAKKLRVYSSLVSRSSKLGTTTNKPIPFLKGPCQPNVSWRLHAVCRHVCAKGLVGAHGHANTGIRIERLPIRLRPPV